MDGFCWYARKMVRRSFSVFAIDDRLLAQSPIPDNAPLIVYANHPAWWDPIVAMLLCREYFPKRSYFAPIDSEALKKYQVFKKLGYYGIDLKSSAGAMNFLKISSQILAMSDSSLWITPEGKFTDPRDPNPPFLPGIAHLASKFENIHCLPLAIEYSFHQEKLASIFCRFGTRLTLPKNSKKSEWSQSIENGLRDSQKALASSIIDRDLAHFRVLLAANNRLK
jgi:1-acyl-sn-glycerol-3-phosphate acyltransferase